MYRVHFQEVIRNTMCSSGKESEVHGHQLDHHSTSCKSARALSVLWVYLSIVLCLFYLGCQLFEAVTSSSSSGTCGCAAYSTVGPSSHVITRFGLNLLEIPKRLNMLANDSALSTPWRCALLDTQPQERFPRALHCSVLSHRSQV